MIKRKLNGNEIIPIGFGTSTFVKGKLCPTADSKNGIDVLNYVADNGVTVIHSSQTLLTQWGIREALCGRKDREKFLHLVKAKLNSFTTYNDIIQSYADNSNDLNFGIILLQLEFENGVKDSAKNVVIQNLVECNEEKKYPLYLYLNSKEDAENFIGMEGINGFVSKYNKISNWITPFIHEINEANQEFIAVSPFSGGKNVDLCFLHDILAINDITCIIMSSGNRYHWADIFKMLR